MSDEKILKKVSKLLKEYGVSDEEREKFMLDVKDAKYDDSEEVEEITETEETETEVPENEDAETTEEAETEQVEEENVETEDVGETETEENEAPETTEQPTEDVEQPTEEPTQPVEQHTEEMQNTINGLIARIESLESVIAQLGHPVQKEEEFGTSPTNETTESQTESSFNRINRYRMGR